MVKKWFKPKRHTGFDKDKTVKDNVRTMMLNADHRKSEKGRLLQVGRQAQALANVTTDRETQKKAQAVANRAFGRR